jgi:outer membrane protein OmpU
MKKVLFATTALLATAGMAAADINFGGYARFGLTYTDTPAAGADNTNTASRMRLNFSASTETNGGMEIGFRNRIHVEENGTGVVNGTRFHATTGGFTVGLGNIFGVIESAPGLYMPTKSAGVGLEGNGFHSLAANTDTHGSFTWTGYSSAAAGAVDGIELMYSVDGFGVHAHLTDTTYAFGANLTTGNITLAIATEEFNDGAADGDTITFASVGVDLGNMHVGLSAAEDEDASAGTTAQKVSARGTYDLSDATMIYGFATNEDNNVGSAFGLGVSHDLGGSASFEAGWTQTTADVNLASAGLFFSF